MDIIGRDDYILIASGFATPHDGVWREEYNALRDVHPTMQKIAPSYQDIVSTGGSRNIVHAADITRAVDEWYRRMYNQLAFILSRIQHERI